MPKRRREQHAGIDERTWSARQSVHPRDASAELVHYSPLPAETGPVWAPDRLGVWPLEGGRYGIDAHYFGATGAARAERQAQRLQQAGLRASAHTDGEGTLVRLGPLTNAAVWIALESFLGRAVDEGLG
jgi:hypothetical protein